MVKVWSNSVNKCPRYRANNVCSGRTHGRTDAHTNTLETMPPATTLAEHKKRLGQGSAPKPAGVLTSRFPSSCGWGSLPPPQEHPRHNTPANGLWPRFSALRALNRLSQLYFLVTLMLFFNS